MDETIQTQVETYLTHLNGLIRRGRELGEALATDPADPAAIAGGSTLARGLRCNH